jgi:hypothetical protein
VGWAKTSRQLNATPQYRQSVGVMPGYVFAFCALFCGIKERILPKMPENGNSR